MARATRHRDKDKDKGQGQGQRRVRRPGSRNRAVGSLCHPQLLPDLLPWRRLRPPRLDRHRQQRQRAGSRPRSGSTSRALPPLLLPLPLLPVCSQRLHCRHHRIMDRVGRPGVSVIVSMHSIRRVDGRRRDMDQRQRARGRFWTLCRMSRRLRRRKKCCGDGGLFLISSSKCRDKNGTRLSTVTSRRIQKKIARRKRMKTVMRTAKKKKKKSKSRTYEANNSNNNNNAVRGAAGRCSGVCQARQARHNNSANDKAIPTGPRLPLRTKPARPWRATSTTLTTPRRPRTSPPMSLLLL